jgi:hypothetical protein
MHVSDGRWRIGPGVPAVVLASSVLCPCHVLVGLAALLVGGHALTPAAQDGLHAVYVPLALIGGAVLLRRR